MFWRLFLQIGQVGEGCWNKKDDGRLNPNSLKLKTVFIK